MPTYQYACTECEHEFEVVQSFSDAAITKCEECGGEVRKKFGAVGVVFKGSGFYRTDSREKKKPDTKPKKDEKAKDASKKDTPKAEKKTTKTKTEK
ncbi:MAG: FmdB family zinc ribbon protein [Actinomycetes bacterium]